MDEQYLTEYSEEDYLDDPEEGYEDEPDGDLRAHVEWLEHQIFERIRDEVERDLEQFAEEHPDVRDPEILDAMSEYLSAIVERTGDESLMVEPEYVKLAYEAVKGSRPAQSGPEIMEGIAEAGEGNDVFFGTDPTIGELEDVEPGDIGRHFADSNVFGQGDDGLDLAPLEDTTESGNRAEDDGLG